MKRPDLSAYFARFPNDVKPVNHTYVNLVAYIYQDSVQSIVLELPDGRLARYQQVGDPFDFETITEAEVLDDYADTGDVELFANVQAMIEADEDVTT